MIVFLRHPSFRHLSCFADGELGTGARDRIARHLAECACCREELRFIRTLDEAARSLPLPDPGDDLLDRILARQGKGDRVILPVADPPPRRRPSARIASIAAAAAVVLAAAVLLSGDRAAADRSVLEFTPPAPRQGEAVEVRFESSLFAGDEVLRLRARYRDADGGVRYVAAADLVRDERGLYQGRFRLPADVRFAAFAVEDPAATTVAHNDRRLWELLVHDDAGAAVPSALEQQIADRAGRSFRLALESARVYARSYPGRPEAWRRLYYYESQIGTGKRDSLAAAHRVRFRALHERFAGRADVSPDRMAALMFYAWDLGETEAKSYWLERLAAAVPDHEAVATARLAEAVLGSKSQEAVLARLDALWEQGGAHDPQIARAAVYTAFENEDRTALARWAKRIGSLPVQDAAWLAGALAADSSQRTEALAIARDALRRIETAEAPARRLLESRSEHDRSMAKQRQRLLFTVASVLEATGETALAAALIERATRGGWNPDVFRRAAELRLAAGDTAGAIPFLARIAVDPLTAATFTDSVRARLPGHFDEYTWSALIRQARAELARWAMGTAVNEPLGPELTLLRADGGSAPLLERDDPHVTVLIYWDTQQWGVRSLEPTLAKLADWLGPDIPLVTIVSLAPDTRLATDVGRRIPQVRLLFDPSGRARSALAVLHAPEFMILDAVGRIRFRGISPEDAARQAAALLVPEASPVLAED